MAVTLKPGLLSIGEVSRRSRLTIVALRHYDKEGLLKPAEVDARSGYRYYRPEQLTTALQLALLRGLAVPIDELRSWVRGDVTTDEMLARHRTRLARERDERDEMISLVDALARGGLPAYSIERSVEPARHGVALAIDSSWSRLEQATRHGLARLVVVLARVSCRGVAGERAAPATGALFPIDPGERVTVTVFALDVVNEADALAGSPLEPVELTPVEALTTVHRGDQRLLGHAYRALLDHCAASGRVAAGPVREHYGYDTDGVPSTRVVLPVGLA